MLDCPSLLRRLRTGAVAAATAALLTIGQGRAASARDPAPPPPRLIVAISVDQFAADLFDRYRPQFTGGMARLLVGQVFASGYQSHAATETCPGHSTILTGAWPARSGIIANDWYDAATARPDKRVYCAEDETVAGSDHDAYTASPVHLRVPTLGDRMKAADPRSRVVAVAGKDRAALMMGGHQIDQAWWWKDGRFVTLAGRTDTPATLTRANAAIAAQIATARAPLDPPPSCQALERAVTAGTVTVGTGRFERAAGDISTFRSSPELDGATLAIAAGLIQEMKLGRGRAPDVIAVGLSATDYVGHSYGNGGIEMCLQMLALDRSLGDFFRFLDGTGIAYQVVLTADHGAQDIPERAGGTHTRAVAGIGAKPVGDAVQAALGLAGNPLHAIDSHGDVWIDPAYQGRQRERVLAEAIRRYRAFPQVAAVFTRDTLAATPAPSGPPDVWTLQQRARAAFYPERSGDFVVLLKEGVTPVASPRRGLVVSHGIPWRSDGRVPILFWRSGNARQDVARAVETVDIMPTLAAMLHLRVPASEIDGRCLPEVAHCPH